VFRFVSKAPGWSHARFAVAEALADLADPDKKDDDLSIQLT